jgi:hypothetical protein
MDKSFSKILMIVTLLLAIIGVVLYYLSADGADAAMGNYVGYSMLLLIIGAGLAFVFSIFNMIKKPALLKKTLLSFGVMAIVLAIAYFIADGSTVNDASGKVFLDSAGAPYSAGTYKWVATFIVYSLILMMVGAVLFLVDMIKNLIK